MGDRMARRRRNDRMFEWHVIASDEGTARWTADQTGPDLLSKQPVAPGLC